MSLPPHWSGTWQTPDGGLRAYTPTVEEITSAAPALAAFYNDAYNRAMMSNTVAMSPGEVVEHFQSVRAAAGLPFLLERDGELFGDADFRHVEGGTAEFAILIGRRPDQGKGLGTRFALLLHALAFGALDLGRVFVSIIPANLPSQRLFAKLGYQPDRSPAARAFAEDESDITLSLGRDAFASLYASATREIAWEPRQR